MRLILFVLEKFKHSIDVRLPVIAIGEVGIEYALGDGSIEVLPGVLVTWYVKALDHLKDLVLGKLVVRQHG
jgi:hypothetical protein